MVDHPPAPHKSNPGSHPEGQPCWSLLEGILPILIVPFDIFHGSISFSGGSELKKRKSLSGRAKAQDP
jgi:hypothetical protein